MAAAIEAGEVPPVEPPPARPPVVGAPCALELAGATYEYPAWALRDITFDVLEGEFFGIAGHTGSGKSTLIQLASGLLKPTAGTARFGKRGDVGVVFQYPERQLFAATVFDDVAFGPRNLGLSGVDVEARVAEALAQVHLDAKELRDTSPFALSGGMQRRVAIAGVLAMLPHVLIFDEPTAGLDPRSRAALLALVDELHAAGRTIVMVSHNMDDLARLCNRIAILNDGRLEAVGTPSEVFANASRLREIGLEAPFAHMVARKA
ncbi:MAG: energy-coupling factor transporter ATPase [Eggerthellaceae bacterium]|nr:energy-coupling factor transporter ATPase [Eggerthellaceae bacterium]